MVTREYLERAGLRAYEAGRVRMALRVGLVIAPLAALCVFTSDSQSEGLCCAAGLVALATWLRWRDRGGVDSVTVGLVAGLLPLAGGLLLARLGFHCRGSVWCVVALVCLGVFAGLGICLHSVRTRGRWLPATVVAALAAGLGCLELGSVALAAVTAGMVVGAVVAAIAVAILGAVPRR